MHKILQLEDHFPTGEPTVSLVGFHDRSGRLVLEKKAFEEGKSPLYAFLSTVVPEPGWSFLLVNALGCYEAYDDNRNGDGFPAEPYNIAVPASCGHPECSKTDEGWISEPETLLHHYKSFEKHGGIYKHHVNKDPTKSLGSIVKAVWNPRMKRVELLLKMENKRDPQMADKLAAGEFPAVSMGAHVRWDVCTICGHRAPTRAQYCEHASRSLRKVLPDGRKVSVLNPSPKFFDISFVFRPADPTGWMLKKVAEEQAFSSAELGERLGAYELRSRDLTKLLPAATSYVKVAQEVVREWPRAEEAVLSKLAEAPLNVALSKLAENCVLLSVGEVAKLFTKRAGVVVAESTLDRIVALQPVLSAVLAKYSNVEEELQPYLREDFKSAFDISPVLPWLIKRASVSEYVRDSLYSPSSAFQMDVGPGARYRALAPPKTEMLTMTDPSTGHVYQTTRGAAQEANATSSRNAILGSALLGTAYAGGLRLALGPRAGRWVLPVGLAAGYGTLKALKHIAPQPFRNPYYMTDQNIPVSGGTVFEKMSSATVAHRDAFDFVERGVNNSEELLNKIASNGGSRFVNWVKQPIDTQLSFLTKGAEIEGPDAFTPPSLNLSVFSTNLQAILWA